MARNDYQRGALPYQFVSMPKDILRSPEWQGLPAGAKALALDLMGQYTGKNNGRLCPAFGVMERCGWKAEKTLLRAKVALLECSFVCHTRKGHPPRTTDWIGFTWWKLDWDKSMSIQPREFPYLNFVKPERIDPNQGRAELKTKTVSVLSKRQDDHPKGPLGTVISTGLAPSSEVL